MENAYLFGELEDMILNIIGKAADSSVEWTEEESLLLSQSTAAIQLQTLRQLREYSLRKRDPEELRIFIRQHYRELIEYMNQVYLAFFRSGTEDDLAAGKVLLASLEELRQMISDRFADCIRADEKVPHYVLRLLKGRLEKDRPTIERLLTHEGTEPLKDIVTSALDRFITKVDRNDHIYQQETSYLMTVIDDIINNDGRSPIVSDCPPLHELVVYWNLNDKDVIAYFTRGIDAYIKGLDTENEVVEWLFTEIKHIRSIPVMPGMVYDERYPGVSEYFLDYLQNELAYREQRNMGFIPKDAERPIPKFKVSLNLSSDQIGIFLKALDDLRIIAAKSLSAVFKAIVPFLSTDRKKDLSWQSMRSKSLAVEDRDKTILIEILEKIIDHLRKN